MKNKKGFTLIELLVVIIILAVIALIATPVVLNVVENAKKSANKNSVYGLMDSAKLYYAESLLDTSKQNNINGTTNVIDNLSISGDKPDSGFIFINNKGETALAVVYDKVCYKKNFNENDLTENEDVENCKLDIEETPSTPEVSYKCKRALELHTEECTQTSNYCNGAGYTVTGSKETTTITYGNLGTTGILTSGDAFDCDVNGDGVYDPITERFYYVSDLYNTTTKSFDSNYVVLIYYNNTTKGVADNTSASLVTYNSANVNNLGPVTGVGNLPTAEQWSNVSLANTTRQILTQTGTTSTNAGTIEPYSYSGYAARLLTAQEVNSACGITVGSKIIGELDNKCNYLMENTKYSDDSFRTYGYWLETPDVSTSNYVWFMDSYYRRVSRDNSFNTVNSGVRPVIEVLKTDILY